jgi:hypothetical protein
MLTHRITSTNARRTSVTEVYDIDGPEGCVEAHMIGRKRFSTDHGLQGAPTRRPDTVHVSILDGEDGRPAGLAMIRSEWKTRGPSYRSFAGSRFEGNEG